MKAVFFFLGVAACLLGLIVFQYWQKHSLKHEMIENVLYFPDNVVGNSIKLGKHTADGAPVMLTMSVEGESQRGLYEKVLKFLKSKGFIELEQIRAIKEQFKNQMAVYEGTKKYKILVEGTSFDWTGSKGRVTVLFGVFPDAAPGGPNLERILSDSSIEFRQRLTYFVWMK
jgi:hypothetical protein